MNKERETDSFPSESAGRGQLNFPPPVNDSYSDNVRPVEDVFGKGTGGGYGMFGPGGSNPADRPFRVESGGSGLDQGSSGGFAGPQLTKGAAPGEYMVQSDPHMQRGGFTSLPQTQNPPGYGAIGLPPGVDGFRLWGEQHQQQHQQQQQQGLSRLGLWFGAGSGEGAAAKADASQSISQQGVAQQLTYIDQMQELYRKRIAELDVQKRAILAQQQQQQHGAMPASASLPAKQGFMHQAASTAAAAATTAAAAAGESSRNGAGGAEKDKPNALLESLLSKAQQKHLSQLAKQQQGGGAGSSSSTAQGARTIQRRAGPPPLPSWGTQQQQRAAGEDRTSGKGSAGDAPGPNSVQQPPRYRQSQQEQQQQQHPGRRGQQQALLLPPQHLAFFPKRRPETQFGQQILRLGDGHWQRMSRDLVAQISGIRSDENERAVVLRLADSVQEVARSLWPEATVKPFGSSVNTLGLGVSDVDLTVLMPSVPAKDHEAEAEVLIKLAEALKQGPYDDVQEITHARIPILKFKDQTTALKVDICINNVLAVHNTQLLLDYVSMDWRVHMLALIVKHWARRRGVNEPYLGTLSSYAYVLMVLWYCQLLRPPLLPVLQSSDTEPAEGAGADKKKQQQQQQQQQGVTMVEGWNVAYDRSAVAEWKAHVDRMGNPNRSSLGQLLAGFFVYFGHEFDWNGYVVSPRTGRMMKRREKNWQVVPLTDPRFKQLWEKRNAEKEKERMSLAEVESPGREPKLASLSRRSSAQSSEAEDGETDLLDDEVVQSVLDAEGIEAAPAPAGGRITPANPPREEAVRFERIDRHLVSIEDPFELDHDLGRVVSVTGKKSVFNELDRGSKWMLAPNRELDGLFTLRTVTDRSNKTDRRSKRKDKRSKPPQGARGGRGGGGGGGGNRDDSGRWRSK